MIRRVKGLVASYAAAHPDLGVDPERALYLDSSNRFRSGSVLLYFAGAEPALVAKVAHTPFAAGVIANEYEVLGELERRGLNRDRPRVPRRLGIWKAGGGCVTMQMALPGAPMKNLPVRSILSVRRAPATIGAVTSWWQHFVALTGSERRTVDSELYRVEVLDELRALHARFALSPAEEDLLGGLFEQRPALLGEELPLVAEHGDFCTANVMTGPGGVAVFDWELPLQPRLPLFDLFVFLSSLRVGAGPRREVDHFSSFCSIFWGQHQLARHVRRRLRGIAGELGIAAELLGDLLVLAVVRAANLKADVVAGSYDGGQKGAEYVHRDLMYAVDKNAPLARLQRGTCHHLRAIAARGVPDFSS